LKARHQQQSSSRAMCLATQNSATLKGPGVESLMADENTSLSRNRRVYY